VIRGQLPQRAGSLGLNGGGTGPEGKQTTAKSNSSHNSYRNSENKPTKFVGKITTTLMEDQQLNKCEAGSQDCDKITNEEHLEILLTNIQIHIHRADCKNAAQNLHAVQ